MSTRRLALARDGKAGTPCIKGFLKFNTEFTEKPICTASRQYQTKKLKELEEKNLSGEAYQKAYDKIIEPECLCIGLGVSALMSKGLKVASTEKVTICPGPNLAYFNKISTLKEMVDHIYGRMNILDNIPRPNMFLKELNMYLDIFKKRVEDFLGNTDDVKEKKQLAKFRDNLLSGIDYYKTLFAEKKTEVVSELEKLVDKYPVLEKEI